MNTEVSFASLDLAPAVQRAIEEVGYEQPSPIQARSVPHLLAGRDLLGVAQTGTGKTAAFAWPTLSRIDLDKTKPQVLILTPTRELAIQVSEAYQRYAGKLSGFRIVPIYGGQEYGGQLRQLRRGVHVVVGTPGRVMDHIRRGSLVLDQLQTLVLDEADEMLRMGFLDDVEWILQHVPEQRQTALFSATMPPPIRKVAETYLTDPSEVRIKAETATVEHTEQRVCLVRPVDKLEALTRILETENFDGMLIFVRTKNATVELAERIEARGFTCDALNGDMNQSARERTVGRFRSGSLDILIATDVAARGIDVPRISHVVNFDIPYDTEAYIHRIGRTGRAGRTGKAITFVSLREQRLLRAIERATRSPIEQLEVPGHKQLAKHRIEAFKQQMQEILSGDQELDFFRKLICDFADESGCSTEDAAAALAFLQQRKRPLQPPPDKKKMKPQKPAKPVKADKALPRTPDSELERYRIQVGREHGATPGHIVGAIANEAGLASRHIGRIQLYDRYSTVDLPHGMPSQVLRHLKRVRICQLPMAIRRDDGRPSEARPGGRPRRDKPRHDKPQHDKPQHFAKEAAQAR
ncbi:MAG: DEAD/DEAH box helicase [bacterium]|nr:DEAD/DEAH box helicase [bacterium]